MKAKILVADDEAKIREALEDLLVIEGYSVLQAKNGQEVIDMVDKGKPDVILLDLHMPGMGGLEVTKILKSDEDLMHIPIIIVTGQNDMQSRVESLKYGADDFLTKPPHYAELSARVKSLVKVKAYNDYMRSHQKMLEHQVAERTKQLQKAMERAKQASIDTIYHLSRAAEYRDEDTSTHLQRMSNYAAALGREAGLPEKDLEILLYATPLHDIGKIGIPDKILLKSGKLEPEEWVLMKQHTTIGEEILKNSSSEYLQIGRIIAKTHHEKWDGSGYPLGLKTDTIPLEGRITAVADVFDALTTKRPYKEAFPVDVAFNIIREGKGNHFDPELADSFLHIEDKILQIKQTYDSIEKR